MSATVRVRYRPADIWVEVADDGRGLDGRGLELPPGGHGLRGMQIRVEMLGGEFDARLATTLAASPGGGREWGICTECGMGRASRNEIPALLDLHRQIMTAG